MFSLVSQRPFVSRPLVVDPPHLTIPRQRTLVYGGKLLVSNAAAKLPEAISQKRHDGFSFLNDGNLDRCLSKKKIRLTTPALWLSSPHWAKCMTKSKFLETACKNYALIRRRPVTCVYLDLGISQTAQWCSIQALRMHNSKNSLRCQISLVLLPLVAEKAINKDEEAFRIFIGKRKSNDRQWPNWKGHSAVHST